MRSVDCRDRAKAKRIVSSARTGVSLDAGELEGLSEEDLRRKYEVHARGTVEVPGAGSQGEDLSDMVAKEMAIEAGSVYLLGCADY